MPVTASTRRMPAATPPSETILKSPMSPVRATCVPPQSSREEPMSSTRTSSPYFSPKSIIAPTFLRLVDGHRRARSSASLRRISALTIASTRRISSALIGALCAKSKRVLSASTSEPFCCTCAPSTSRSALCIRCVAEWLRIVRRAPVEVDLRRRPRRPRRARRSSPRRGGRRPRAGSSACRSTSKSVRHAPPSSARRGRRPGRRTRRRTACGRARRRPSSPVESDSDRRAARDRAPRPGLPRESVS